MVSAQQIGRMMIEFSVGDLLRTQTDVIVNSIGGDANLYTAGVLARTVGQQGGASIQNELSQKIREFDENRVVLTSGGNLPSTRYILHLKNSVSHRHSFSPRIEKALVMANSAGFHVIAFPALGSGGCGHSPVSMATEFVEAIKSFMEESETESMNLTTIKFVFEVQGTKNIYTQIFQMSNRTNSSRAASRVSPIQPIASSNSVVSSQGGPMAPAPIGRVAGATQSQGQDVTAAAADAFECKICLTTMRPPVVLCVHCQQLIGCDQCITQTVSTGVARCPMCRHVWLPYGRDVQQVKGLDGFLGQIA